MSERRQRSSGWRRGRLLDTAPVTPDAAVAPATTPDAAVAVAAIDAAIDAAETVVVVAADGGAGSSVVPPVIEMANITLTSTPSGAAIWIDGKDTGKRTPSPIQVDKARRAVTITLRLAQHDDLVLKKFSVTGDVEKALKLRKRTVTTPGRGSGSGRVDDTKLERPE